MKTQYNKQNLRSMRDQLTDLHKQSKSEARKISKKYNGVDCFETYGAKNLVIELEKALASINNLINFEL